MSLDFEPKLPSSNESHQLLTKYLFVFIVFLSHINEIVFSPHSEKIQRTSRSAATLEDLV